MVFQNTRLLYSTKRVTGRICSPQTSPHRDIYLHQTKSASQHPLPFPTLPCTQAVHLCALLPNTLHRLSICQHRQKDDTSITQCKFMSGVTSCHPARVSQMATCRKRPTSASTQSSTKSSQLASIVAKLKQLWEQRRCSRHRIAVVSVTQ